MPKQRRGKSKQDWATPPEFLDAVRKFLGIKQFAWDLAADEKNTVVPTIETADGPIKRHFDIKDDALLQSWFKLDGWLWCNPPFANLYDWTDKASTEKCNGAKIAMLVPAGVGTEWWSYNVHEVAWVMFLSPRLKFVGAKDSYPKDLALLLYQPQGYYGYQTWRWK